MIAESDAEAAAKLAVPSQGASSLPEDLAVPSQGASSLPEDLAVPSQGASSLPEDLASALGICAPAARVLRARGLTEPEAARRYLSPAASDLHDPYLLKDMDRAAPRLARAIEQRESILLYGDYDVDGTTALV